MVQSKTSFNWRSYLKTGNLVAAPVSCFKHVMLSNSLENIVGGIIVEIKSPDCTTCPEEPCCYWIAAVQKISGYLALMRYEGFDMDPSQDFWINLVANKHFHPIGWCAETGMPLVPPKMIEDKHVDWKEYLARRISRVRTVPPDYHTKVDESLRCFRVRPGSNVEALDANLSSARPGVVLRNFCGRLSLEDGRWSHELDIHPVGWAAVSGVPLVAKEEYATLSLAKALFRNFDPMDIPWDMLPKKPSFISNFQEGMILEAVNAINPSHICLVTVQKVLRGNVLVLRIEGSTDTFCSHGTSPTLFPIGYCDAKEITLTPPKGHKGEFDLSEYLTKISAVVAPRELFKTENVNHGFQTGMHLEAVDLVEPSLVCVAKIVNVVDRLLRIHFIGWEEQYDQWCDWTSRDIYPIGWCEIAKLAMEAPPHDELEKNANNLKTEKPKQKRRKRQLFTRRKRHVESNENVEAFDGTIIKMEPEDVDENSSMSN